MDSHLGKEKAKLCWEQSFGQHIGEVVLGSNVECLQGSTLNLFSHEVAIYLYMLSSLMKNWISYNMESSLIVTKQHSRFG